MREIIIDFKNDVRHVIKIIRQIMHLRRTHVEIRIYTLEFEEKEKVNLHLDLHGDWYYLYHKQVSIKKQILGSDEIVKLYDYLKKIKYLI